MKERALIRKAVNEFYVVECPGLMSISIKLAYGSH